MAESFAMMHGPEQQEGFSKAGDESRAKDQLGLWGSNKRGFGGIYVNSSEASLV